MATHLGDTTRAAQPAPLSSFRAEVLDFGVVFRLWNSVYAFLCESSILTSITALFQTSDVNGAVSWGKVVFLTSCLVTMTGYGLLSSTFRHRNETRPSEANSSLSQNKDCRIDATEASTSSDEEESDDGDEARNINNTLKKIAGTDYRDRTEDAINTDPGLLKKHSLYMSFTTALTTYPSIRTFYCPHPHMNKLPTRPTPIPLLVFVHGLGGSLAQFHHLLTSLSNIGPCFGIDFPGCGLSAFSPTSWDAYSVDALAELLLVAIEGHRDKEAGQRVVLIAHSLGCSLSAMLASSAWPKGAALREHILGLVSICPRASPPSPNEVTTFRRFLHVPNAIFDLWRAWDRRGGTNSASIARFLGASADNDTRELQVRFNKQSKTSVWRRIAWGTLPTYNGKHRVGGIPGEEIWSGVQTSVLLVAGESDAITRPAEVEKILQYFGCEGRESMNHRRGSIIPDASEIHDQIYRSYSEDDDKRKRRMTSKTPEARLVEESVPPDQPKQKRAVESVLLPAPASHALLYDRATYRTLAGIIQDFLLRHVDNRLGLGWQLQYLNTSGKWDVKNVTKWKGVTPVSEPIGNIFVGLKTLREVDRDHNPTSFSKMYRNKIYAIIDISHENPVYNPSLLEEGSVHYHKLPTVSKIPPTSDETRDFISLVDRLEREITDEMEKLRGGGPRPLIGVHCHYGFNRTGFMIACYLIERKGYRVREAIHEFGKRRPPGIRHGHFIDTLFVRYCSGLERAPAF